MQSRTRPSTPGFAERARRERVERVDTRTDYAVVDGPEEAALAGVEVIHAVPVSG
jgi:hypothetical protein